MLVRRGRKLHAARLHLAYQIGAELLASHRPFQGGIVGKPRQQQALLQLVDRALPLQQRLADEHLGDDAAEGPRVDRERVASRSEQDLGRAVPARRHIVRQDHGRLLRLGL